MTDLSPAAPPREPVTIEETCPNHTMKDLRTLCDEAIQFWDACCDMDDVISEMRAHLAQPVQPSPTDQELLAIAAASIDPYQNSGIAIGEYEPETERAVEVYGSELIAFARAALARWGK